MAEICQALDPDNALILHLPFLAIELLKNRASTIGLGKKDDLDPCHPSHLDREYRIIEIACQVILAMLGVCRTARA